MSFATDKWFKHLREEILVEGLNDIGLPQELVDIIRSNMPSASEKGRVWVGNAFKDTKPEWQPSSRSSVAALSAGNINPSFYDDIREYQDRFGSYYQNQGFNILEELLESMGREKYSTILKKRKSFIKSSKKLGIDQKISNLILQFVDDYIEKSLTTFLSMIENTVLTLNQDPNNYKKAILFDKKVFITTKDPDTGEERTRTKYLYDSISDFPPSEWNEVEEKAVEYQETRDKEDLILYTFDDGSYWYDLESSYCDNESERMGHCGADSRGTLYSLRKKDKGEEISKSYVTIAYDNESTIFQIKGRFNKCPPKSLWSHVAEFITLKGVQFLEEDGEHSTEPEEFEEFGEWLSGETGVKFLGGRQTRLRNFQSECIEYEEQFAEYLQHTNIGDVEVTDDWDDDWDEFSWYLANGLTKLSVQVPFKLENKYLSYHENDIGMNEEWHEAILEMINEYDPVNRDLENQIDFIRAKSISDAILKSRRGRMGAEEYQKDKKLFLVVGDLDDVFDEDEYDRHHPENYRLYLNNISDFVNAVKNSLDDIENYLIKQRVVKPSEIQVYKQKIEEEFNNFKILSAPAASSRDYEVIATDILLYTTSEEMDAIVKTGMFGRLTGLYKIGDQFYTSLRFRNKILNILKSKNKEAEEFAKKQITLNYGSQYSGGPEELWNKLSAMKGSALSSPIWNGMLAAFSTNREQNIKRIDTRDYFTYKLTFSINERTFPYFAPFLEYYDNNFDLIIKAFEKAVKDEILKSLEEYKLRTGNETNIPMQEARANPLDVRLYEIDFVMSYPLQNGFEITDIHNIVRAIPNVTTVRTIGTKRRTQGNRSISLQRLKFALQGQKSRKEWVKQILIPQIHKISSTIRLHRVEPADLVSSSKQRLEELYYNSSMRQSPGRTTPVPTIQSLIDDWVEGGVMYDQPTNLNLTRYSVMMPVEDLKHLCSREARKHGHHFDAGYQKFIENGPRDPIYLAIGKNGRARITGNEDDLRYAIKAGVEELPVFISYQRQV